jgi:hypothetical protein
MELFVVVSIDVVPTEFVGFVVVGPPQHFLYFFSQAIVVIGTFDSRSIVLDVPDPADGSAIGGYYSLFSVVVLELSVHPIRRSARTSLNQENPILFIM